jgi:hypothetical protein
MPALFLFIVRFFRLLMSGHQAVALENAALRLWVVKKLSGLEMSELRRMKDSRFRR